MTVSILLLEGITVFSGNTKHFNIDERRFDIASMATVISEDRHSAINELLLAQKNIPVVLYRSVSFQSTGLQRKAIESISCANFS